MPDYPDFGWFHPCSGCGGTLLLHPSADTARHVVVEDSGRVSGRVRCKQEEGEHRG